MSTSSLRATAAGLTLIFAVLTGLLTGVVGAPECQTVEAPTPSSPAQDPDHTTPPPADGSGEGDSQDQQQDQDQVPSQPEGNDEQPATDPEEQEPEQPGTGQSAEPITAQNAIMVPLAAQSSGCEDSSFSTSTALAGFLGAAVAGGAVTGLLFVRRRGTTTVPTDPDLAARTERAEKERATLIQAAIYVRDRATSKALADRLGWALQEVGVTTRLPHRGPVRPGPP